MQLWKMYYLIGRLKSRLDSPSRHELDEPMSSHKFAPAAAARKHVDRGHVIEKQHIRDIPKRQRFAGGPTLKKLFGQRSPGKRRRDQLIAKAVSEFG